MLTGVGPAGPLMWSQVCPNAWAISYPNLPGFDSFFVQPPLFAVPPSEKMAGDGQPIQTVSQPLCQPFPEAVMVAPVATDPPPAYVPCVYVAPAQPSRMTLTAVTGGGQSMLEIHHGDEPFATCDHLMLKVAGCGELKVYPRDQQVRIHGDALHAVADCVVRQGSDDHILLEGHVQVHYQKSGQWAKVVADRVVVGLADSQLEIKVMASPESPSVKDGERMEVRPFRVSPSNSAN